MIKKKLSRSVQLLISGGVVLGSGIVVMPAYGQTQSQTSTDSTTIQRVEITGSSIRRTDSETPSPVQVISAEDLKKTGYTSVSQVLANVTANGQGTLSQGFAGAFAAGASGISLRGLTTGATLVLIDGHRMAPNALSDDGQRSFVDTSNIPFDTIDRIEILKDGASAVYGSDAMAGVVNVILKKVFIGTTVNAEGGTTQQGGGTTFHASVTHGFGDLEADGYNAYASLEYRHSDAITQASRAGNSLNGGWTTTNFSPWGGVSYAPGTITAFNPTPIIPGSTYIYDPVQGFAPGSTAFLNGNCNYNALVAGGCAYTPTNVIQPETQNINLMTSFTKRLSDGWELNVKASVFDAKTYVGADAQHPAFPQGFNPFLVMSANGPTYLAGTTIPQITIPANYPGNTLQVPALVVGNDPSGPLAESVIDSKNYRLVAELTGTLGDWEVKASGGVTRNQINQDFYGGMNIQAMNAALNRCANTSSTSCVPYSLTGANSAADIAAIYPSSSAVAVSNLSFLELNAQKPVLDLEGGSMVLSVGAAYIYRDLNAQEPQSYLQGIVPSYPTFVEGSQINSALYSEVYMPVTKTLELDGHVRYDHIDSDNAVTPKVEFKWNATDAVAFRGTYSTGFRAPNPAESGKSGALYAGLNGWDTVNCPGGPSGNATGSAPAAGSFISACGTPGNLSLPNANLQPEKSRSSTLGMVLEPVRGWSSTIDLYQIKVTDQIITSATPTGTPVRSPNPTTGLCADGNGGSYICTVPGSATTGVILYIPNPYINANSTQVSGLELESHYKWKLGEYGTLLTSLDWSHNMSFILTQDGQSYQLAGTHGPSIVGGNTGNPKDRAQATFSWDIGSWDVTTAFNWVGSYSVTDPSLAGATTCQDTLSNASPYFTTVPSNYCNIGSFMTTELTVRYEYSKNLTLHIAANNLFNRQPPVDLSTYGGGVLAYNPSMHQEGAIGRFFQAGLTYSF